VMGTPPAVALALLAVALPVSLWVGLSDLREMRIPNRAVMALALGFAVVGLLCLPVEGWSLGEWGWRWTHLLVLLVIGMALNAVGLMGAGDAKFAAAAAPFVALGDLGTLLALLAAATLAAWLLHRIARASIGPRLAPGWKSWSTGQKFPMGVAFGLTLVAYLTVAAAA
jgi:prepilin peptidase CpaA